MKTCVSKLAYYLPSRVITNDYLSEKCGVDRQFLEEKVGIKERHVAAPDETTSGMAVQACRALLKDANMDSQAIDLLILCTQNPDYRLPTTACLVHRELGLGKGCAAFDINLGCSGFVYGLGVADAMVKSARSSLALVVMADQYSKLIDYRDRSTAALFGDAASAALLQPAVQDDVGILDVDLGTDGQGAVHLIAPNTGVAHEPGREAHLCMNGREILRFSMFVVPTSVERLLARNRLGVEDIDYFIFHQANRFILMELQKRLKIPPKKMIVDMESVGNTVSSTIPIAWKHLWDSGRLVPGTRLVLSGFGVGLSWGTILYCCP
jgi:3-oxoacyl-[acyl-carrier-protein] synthase III